MTPNSMVLSPESLKEYCQKNKKLIVKKLSHIPDVYVLKYASKVFYDHLWDETMVNLRGLVVDGDFNVLAAPFTKIFNRGESGADIERDEEVLAVRKINGFMAAATYLPKFGIVLVSTTGTTTSVFAQYAKDYLTLNMREIIAQHYFDTGNIFTHIFEIVHPQDDTHPIKEQHGIYYLGAREVGNEFVEIRNQVKLDDFANMLGVMRPEWLTSRYSDIVKHVAKVKHEGFVCYQTSAPYKAIKLKSPYYLAKKFLGRMTDQRFHEIVKDPSKAKLKVEGDFHFMIDKIVENSENYVKYTHNERFEFLERCANEYK